MTISKLLGATMVAGAIAAAGAAGGIAGASAAPAARTAAPGRHHITVERAPDHTGADAGSGTPKSGSPSGHPCPNMGSGSSGSSGSSGNSSSGASYGPAAPGVAHQ